MMFVRLLVTIQRIFSVKIKVAAKEPMKVGFVARDVLKILPGSFLPGGHPAVLMRDDYFHLVVSVLFNPYFHCHLTGSVHWKIIERGRRPLSIFHSP